MALDSQKLAVGAGGGALVFLAIIILAVIGSRNSPEDLTSVLFSRRVSECLSYRVGDEQEVLSSRNQFNKPMNVTQFRQICQLQGKRIVINPDKVPYNFSDISLWSMETESKVKAQRMEDNQECYNFDRLEKTLATKVMAKQRWKAVRLKQKFDRNRYNNYTGSYSGEDMFVTKGGSEKEIYVPAEGADTGLFAAVLQAYKNHWVLRTSPDDWFFPLIRRIAQVVDENALKPEVETYLGRGKKPTEALRVNFINGFEQMFEELNTKIKESLVTSEYAQVFSANFSTSTQTDRMVSQLILMSSVQKYFNFDTYIACGIPEIELLGTENDWQMLIKKLEDIRKVLLPIDSALGNISNYLDNIVAPIYAKLLETFRGNVDKDWWNGIVLRQAQVEQVCTKLKKVVERWDGWLVEFLNGNKSQELRDIASGLLTVPMQVSNVMFNVTYMSTLVAGQIGFQVHDENTAVVEPFAGWTMLVTQETHLNVRRKIRESLLARQKKYRKRKPRRNRNWSRQK